MIKPPRDVIYCNSVMTSQRWIEIYGDIEHIVMVDEFELKFIHRDSPFRVCRTFGLGLGAANGRKKSNVYQVCRFCNDFAMCH